MCPAVLKRADGLEPAQNGSIILRVTLDEVKAAFAAPGGGRRELVELPFGGHELSKNPVALKLVMGRIIAHVLGADAEQLIAPGFEEIADLRVADRARAQEHRAALEAPALSATARIHQLVFIPTPISSVTGRR